MIKEDYIHNVVQRLVARDGVERQVVWRGTSAQISERIAASVKQQLDSGDSAVIRLEPIAPANIFDLRKN